MTDAAFQQYFIVSMLSGVMAVIFVVCFVIPRIDEEEDSDDWKATVRRMRKKATILLGAPVIASLMGVMFLSIFLKFQKFEYYNDEAAPLQVVGPGVLQDSKGHLVSGKVEEVVHDDQYGEGVYQEWFHHYVLNEATWRVVKMTNKEVALSNGRVYPIGKIIRQKSPPDAWMIGSDWVGKISRFGTVRGRRNHLRADVTEVVIQ